MAVTQTLTLTEVSCDKATNTSKVRILWQSTQTGTSHNDYTRTAEYSILHSADNIVRKYTVSYTLPMSSTVTILDTTITVPHKDDGTGLVSVITTMNTGISAGTITQTKDLYLTTIPRASTIQTQLGFVLGSRFGADWTPLSASFRYKLKFTTKTWSYTSGIIHPNRTTHYTWRTSDSVRLPFSIATEFPNDDEGTMTATLYTYSDTEGKVQVGTESVASFKVYLSETDGLPDVKMSLSPVTPSAKFASLYLKGRSKVQADFTGTIGQYGATIKSCAMKIGYKTYTAPYTSDHLANSGAVIIYGMATDSRGRSKTISQTINVIEYKAPYISPHSGHNKIVCERSTVGGIPSDTGTYLHIKGVRNYTKINTNGIVNTCSVRCRYKPEGGSWSHDEGKGISVLLSTDTSTDAFDMILPNIVTNTKLAYLVELNSTDDTNIPEASTFTVSSEGVTFHLKQGGKGAAFGKYSNADDLLEVEWNAQFNKDVTIQGDAMADFVVEEGKIGNWYCRKWHSGRADCWYKRNATVDVNTKWGTTLYYGTVASTDYPFEFVEAPMCQLSCEYGNNSFSLFLATCGAGTTTLTPPVMLCRTDAQVVNCNISYYAHGRWK